MILSIVLIYPVNLSSFPQFIGGHEMWCLFDDILFYATAICMIQNWLSVVIQIIFFIWSKVILSVSSTKNRMLSSRTLDHDSAY